MARGRKKGSTTAGTSTAAPRRRRRLRRSGNPAQLSFEAIAIEGGLLSPDWLARVARLDAGGQSEADYRIPKGLNLRDEIGRYWRIAQALWSDFSTGRAVTDLPENQATAVAERFVTGLLRDCFGFGSLTRVDPIAVDGRLFPIGFTALDGRVPVVMTTPRPEAAEAKKRTALDDPTPALGDGTRRRSAFGLCQELLNAADGALWGMASDGLTLRILRDNASLTRPTWIEADLGRIFTEERYADFAALWLLAHETRFGRPGQPVTACSLETWREAGRAEGTRAREQLRHGVEDALVALGQGFLAHPENQALRAALSAGALTKEAYFQELLRLAYRLIFLVTVEERDVLHPDTSDEAARKLYAAGYSLRRLCERAVKRSAHDRHHDHWEAVKIAFRGLSTGEPRLALPALAGIFAADQCPTLDTARLENRFLLLALFRLSWLREEAGLSRVNWRDMGPEELGSVYESLLELVPQLTEGGRSFSFATGGETKGHARKTTGSYYTPDSLVQVLLDSALEPVVERTIAEHPSDAIAALLSLAIVDPACGSGHFLLAAARRLAAHVARLQADGTPSAAEYRHALRQVVGRCVYGVDLNPLAVELCKVSLWMEAVEPGLPLTFLDAHIRHGNALLGTTPELMAKGIPDDAWKPIEGDDKEVARALKKRNKDAAQGQRGLDTVWSSPASHESDELRKAAAALEAAPDADVAALARKEAQWQALLDSDAYHHQKLVADAWCAAFVWPKQPGPLAEAVPTNELWRQIRDRQGHPPDLTVETVNQLAAQYTFFHWHLAFPQVFARGGFDVVLGNPPWEQVQVNPQEFFAAIEPEIGKIARRDRRAAAIADLRQSAPDLYRAFVAAKRATSAAQQFIHASGRFPRSSQGRVNSAPLFLETVAGLSSPGGRAGLIVPTGIATDTFTRHLFVDLVRSGRLRSLFDFENEEFLFPNVHHAMRFCLLALGGTRGHDASVDLLFFARQTRDLGDSNRRYALSIHDFELLNPNTGTCPVFRLRRDVEIVRSVAVTCGVLVDDSAGKNEWSFSGRLMFMMDAGEEVFWDVGELKRRHFTSDDHIWRYGEEQALPLIEGKMIHIFDHRFGTYAGQTDAQARQGKLPECSNSQHNNPGFGTTPRYWVHQRAVRNRLEMRWEKDWYIGWRDITNSKNERTVIAAVIPAYAAGDTLPLALLGGGNHQGVTVCGFLANLCCFVLDYIARQKVSGMHLRFNTFQQLNILPPATYVSPARWQSGIPTSDWLLPRVLELTYTAWDLEPFAHDVGYDGPPFRWDPERRFLLRAELDAAFFHLYGIERDDVDYIMETFPIARKHDEKAHGEYRTKRVILEIYDAMAEAARTGQPYPTRLDPPPADPRVAHPPRDKQPDGIS